MRTAFLVWIALARLWIVLPLGLFGVFFKFCLHFNTEMAALGTSSSHLFLVMFNCFLGAASFRTVTEDGNFLQPSSNQFSDDLGEEVVSQHMYRLYEKYNKENRLKEGNTVRSFRASQGV